MIPPLPLDENLRQFATDIEWAYYTRYAELGSLREVARTMGVTHAPVSRSLSAMLSRAVANGYTLPPIEQITKGVSTFRDGQGHLRGEWVKTRSRGMNPGDAIELPDPKKLVSTATMTDSEGRVIVQWSKQKAEDAQREALWEAFAEQLAKKIEPAAPTLYDLHSNADTMATYPVGDHHLGMLAWPNETLGDAYDLKTAEHLLRSAADRLVDTCPPSDHALIAFLGDFFHYDSYDSVTPTSRNLLDADGRYPKMVDCGVWLIKYVISAALRRHRNVRVIFERGNHDPSTAGAVTVFLKHLYMQEPRVSIDESPASVHYYEFGKTLIGTNHGDKIKMAELPAIMAHDMPEAWGRTRHRVWFTGHIHHDSRKSFPGCTVESFEVLAPPDAYAATRWRSARSMKAIRFHREWGEIERHTVRPPMLEIDLQNQTVGQST